MSRRVCISSQLPGEADAAGPWTSLGRDLEEDPGNLVVLDSYPGFSLGQNGFTFLDLSFPNLPHDINGSRGDAT